MPRQVQSRHFDALGSTCELQTLDASQGALERGEQGVRDAEARFTRFLKDSELAELNRCQGRYTPVSAELFALLQAALWTYQESDGLVSVVVAAVPEKARPMPALPQVLILDPQTRSAAVAPEVAIDLGPIARGFLADLLIDELGDDGVCNLGGDLRVRGTGPAGGGWPVRLCDGSVVTLQEGAVSTIGTGRRRPGQPAQRIIDPRTGLPARTDLAEVSVVADFALRASVYARTALLLGAQQGQAFLSERGVHHALVSALL